MGVQLGNPLAMIWTVLSLFILGYGIFIGSAKHKSDKILGLVAAFLLISVVAYQFATLN